MRKKLDISFILVILLFFLLLVIVSELYIYFYQLNNSRFQKQQVDNYESSDVEKGLAFLANAKKSVALAQAGVLKRSIKTDVYESEIKEIKIEKGTVRIFKYDVKFSLKYKPNEDFVFYLNKNDLAKTKLYSIKNNVKSEIKITDLKAGDIIRVEFTTDNLEYFDNNTVSINIIKL